MKKFDAETARAILASAHDGWSHGAIERMLTYYADDVTYWYNAGALDGTPFEIEGKQGLRTFLMSIQTVAESATAIEDFQFEDGVGRATVSAYVRHRRTGYEISGTYQQIVTFRGRKIVRVEEHHDAVKMAAFWRMVTVDESPSPGAG